MNSIIECEGGNDYNLTHMKKAQLQREGQLPVSIEVTDDFLEWATDEDEWKWRQQWT